MDRDTDNIPPDNPLLLIMSPDPEGGGYIVFGVDPVGVSVGVGVGVRFHFRAISSAPVDVF